MQLVCKIITGEIRWGLSTLLLKMILVMKKIEEIFDYKGVKPTPNRILILKMLLNAERPVSLADIEAEIQTIDKSSIFRVLNLFLEHEVIHVIDDGSGSAKYEVCSSDEHRSISDMHVHFFCQWCHSTYCLDSSPIPPVSLPAGFMQKSANYVIKGLCPKCSSHHSHDEA